MEVAWNMNSFCITHATVVKAIKQHNLGKLKDILRIQKFRGLCHYFV